MKLDIGYYLKRGFSDLKLDIFFQYTVIALFLKTLLFISVLPSPNASRPDPLHAYTSIPPFLIYLCFIAVFLSFSYLFRGRGHIWALIILNLALSIFMAVDIWYYRGYSNLLSPYLFRETANLRNLGASVVSMIRFIDILFFIDIVIFFFTALKHRKLYSEVKRGFASFLLVFIISVSYIYYAHVKIDVLKKGYINQMLFRGSWSVIQNVSNLGPVGYHMFNIRSYLKESRRPVLTEKELVEIQGWFRRKQENIPDNCYKGIFKGKNLIVIQVESLEGFVINQRINGQEITPNINKLLRNSLFFSRIKEQVYNGTSSDAELMLNTSIYPVRSGCTFFRFPYNTYNSLPKMLGRNGYYTSAIHPDRGAYWNWMVALRSIGFNKCIDSTSYNIDEFINLGISDSSYLRQVEPIIKRQKSPFYSFMITLTSHAPFKIPEKYRELNLKSGIADTRLGAYFQSIHYTDKQLGIFIEKLKKDGILDNTVIAIYGDHCGVHKFYQDEVNSIKPSEKWWCENQSEIPFLVYANGVDPRVFDIIGGQIDMMPTIAYLMGIEDEWYSKTALGRNLLKTNRSFAVLSNKSLVGDAGKYVSDAVKGIDISDKIIQSDYFRYLKMYN